MDYKHSAIRNVCVCVCVYRDGCRLSNTMWTGRVKVHPSNWAVTYGTDETILMRQSWSECVRLRERERDKGSGGVSVRRDQRDSLARGIYADSRQFPTGDL